MRPYCDATKTPPLSRREKNVLARLRAGEELHIGREYVKGTSRIVNSFFWSYKEEEWDSPVWMLLRRGLVIATGCAGGAQWIVLNPLCKKKHKGSDMSQEKSEEFVWGGYAPGTYVLALLSRLEDVLPRYADE